MESATRMARPRLVGFSGRVRKRHGNGRRPVRPAVSGISDVTAEFLTSALAGPLGGAEVTAVDATPVGTGQVSDTYRLRLTYGGPAALAPTMIAKVPAADPASRAAAQAVRTYEIEASFYDQLAPGLPVALAHCYYAGY